MSGQKPVRVAIIGGGCASISAAFELTRPEHRGKYEVTVYQLGWRLGGKVASGRGPANRIEEHGLRIWMGFYENAFRLQRECYAELNRDPRKCRFADWRDAFTPESILGVLEQTRGGHWDPRISRFSPADGLPGDPHSENNPFGVRGYVLRGIAMLRVLLSAAQLHSIPGTLEGFGATDFAPPQGRTVEFLGENISRLLKYDIVGGFTGPDRGDGRPVDCKPSRKSDSSSTDPPRVPTAIGTGARKHPVQRMSRLLEGAAITSF
jgi:putative NAD(P)-binding protein